ncbi:MAG: hypothetical protein ACK4PI_08760 [Tepidisphaerales bacterium]
MSRNGSRCRRLAVAVGSVCFLGGLTMSAAPADAGIYLSLRPVASSLPSGATVSGNNTDGYTLNLPASATAQTIQYDLVVQITAGTGTTPASGQLFEVFGAVRGTGSTGVVGSHLGGSTVFTLDPTGAVAATPNFLTGSFTTARRGVATAGPGTIGGVGPQTGTFFNAAGQPSFFHEFIVGSTANNPSPSFSGLPVGTAGIAVARASFQVTGPNVGDSATLSFVGGDGANGFSGVTRWASWSDSVTGVPAFSTHNFDNTLTTAVSRPLTINFISAGPQLVLGDFNFDGFLDAGDIDVFTEALLEDNPYANFIAAYGAAFTAQYSGTLTPAIIVALGDFDNNSLFDADDIDPFIEVVLSSSRPGDSVIPEPAAAGLLVPAMALVLRRRRG